jgi:hypothetical protein
MKLQNGKLKITTVTKLSQHILAFLKKVATITKLTQYNSSSSIDPFQYGYDLL